MGFLKMIGVYEFKDLTMLRRLCAELIGTFLLITFLLSGLHEVKSKTGNAVATGFLLASIIAFTGHISGGHVNPAVTVGMLVCNYIRLLPAICYIIAQVLGAVLGQFMAKLIVREELRKKHYKSMDMHSEFSLEVLETFLLVSVSLSVTDPRRNARGVGSAALAIGLSLAASLCAVTEYKGCMNPVDCLATWLFLKSSKGNWVPWVGPLVGGFLAGLVYREKLALMAVVKSVTKSNMLNTKILSKKFIYNRHKFNLGVDDFKNCRQMIRRLLAELLGTFIYIAILLSGKIKQLNPFANGLLVASVLTWIRPVSGGHINPAITLGAFTCNYINLFPAILYIIAQILGALLGELVANAISSKSLIQFKDAEISTLFVLEMLKTFLVVAVAMSVLGTPTALRLGPIAIGLSIVACLSSTTDYRAMMNPAASLAVAVFYQDFSNHWVFWVGPLLGGLIAGLVHTFVFKTRTNLK